jgi:hypothetical protein
MRFCTGGSCDVPFSAVHAEVVSLPLKLVGVMNDLFLSIFKVIYQMYFPPAEGEKQKRSLPNPSYI